MSIVAQIKSATSKAILSLYNIVVDDKNILVNVTKPEFEGDYTVVLFAFVKQLKKSPDDIGNELGGYLIKHNPDLFSKYNIIKGFLNFTVPELYWMDFLSSKFDQSNFGIYPQISKKVVVEYSSPNTNKPLHLGHLRNNFLGWSVSEILKANGNDVIKTCIVNDRGIHICKSMLAWQMFGNGETPDTNHTKGDHFVGDYYVKFNDEYKRQVEELIAQGVSKEEAEKETAILKSTQDLLMKWEQGDDETMQLWRRMNGWVYKGFDETYKRIGSDFEKT